VGPEDALLAYDKNEDGIICDLDEISYVGYKEGAQTDLEGLTAFDTNQDGLLDANDADFGKFRVWQDLDQDGESDEGELKTLEEAGITSFELTSDGVREERGSNTIFGTGTYHKQGQYDQTNGETGEFTDTAFGYSDYGFKELADGRKILGSAEGTQVLSNENATEDLSIDVSQIGYDGYVSGSGDDELVSSVDGGVLLDGREGNDTITGGAGADWLSGGEGADVISGGEGADVIFMDAEDLTLGSVGGGEGFDIGVISSEDAVSMDLSEHDLEAVLGNKGDDVFTSSGDSGIYVNGEEGDDQITGSAKGDVLIGGDGSDTLSGGEGDDWLFVDGQDNLDNISGGEGSDTLVIQGEEGMDVDLCAVDVETAIGGAGDDTFSASCGKAVSVDGGDGNDSINGGGQDDYLFGGEGDDVIVGGGGSDVIDGWTGDDTLTGGSGKDVFVFGHGRGNDVITDGGPDDHIWLSQDVNVEDIEIVHEGDQYVLTLTDTGETLTVSDQVGGFYISNTRNGQPGFINLTGKSGQDKLMFSGSRDGYIFTFDSNDSMWGNDAGNYINGGEGKDTLLGFGGDDTLAGGAGADVLNGGGYETLTFQAVGQAGYRPGDITLNPNGAGNDTVTYNASDAGVDVDLKRGTGKGGYAEGDSFISIENVTGSEYNDTLSGTGGANVLKGRKGDDIIDARGGDDVIDGGDGNDTIAAGSGNDLITGGKGDDTIDGGEGNDLVNYADEYVSVNVDLEAGTATSSTGNDTLSNVESVMGSFRSDTISGSSEDNELFGAWGDDKLYGRDGDDYLDGGAQNDLLDGGMGDDELVGGSGNDTLLGGEGEDTLTGGDGADSLQGGEGADTLEAGAGDDYVTGNSGDDSLDGGEGKDLLKGGEGADAIIGGDGFDTLYGGTGDDVVAGGAGGDVLDGEFGIDTASYETSAFGVDVNLETGRGRGGDAHGDTLRNIENLTGSARDDTLTGDGNANVIDGKAGDDVIQGGAGADTLHGGEGNDTLSYADSSQGVTVDLDAQTAGGGDAEGDVFDGFENVSGSGHADTLVGSGDANVIDAGSGDDFVQGGAGADTLIGGDGIDTAGYEDSGEGVQVDLSSGTGSGGTAEGDALQGFENLAGSAHDDTLSGNEADNRLDGGAGRDNLYGGAGNDVLNAGEGDDYAAGGDGDDILNGGAGKDFLLGGAGDDTFTGGSGDDYIVGGSGDDTVIFDGDYVEYSVVREESRILVTRLETGEVDILSGVETLKFNDKSVNVADLPISDTVIPEDDEEETSYARPVMATADMMAKAAALGVAAVLVTDESSDAAILTKVGRPDEPAGVPVATDESDGGETVTVAANSEGTDDAYGSDGPSVQSAAGDASDGVVIPPLDDGEAPEEASGGNDSAHATISTGPETGGYAVEAAQNAESAEAAEESSEAALETSADESGAGEDGDTTSVDLAAVGDVVAEFSPVAAGKEGEAISLDLNANVSGIDFVARPFTITGVPDGVTLSAGIETSPGTWSLSQSDLGGLKLMLPDEWSNDFKLTVTTTAYSDSGPVLTSKAVSRSFTVVVEAASETPTISVDAEVVSTSSTSAGQVVNAVAGVETLVGGGDDTVQGSSGDDVIYGDKFAGGATATAALAIEAAMVDPDSDGSESLTVTVFGVPVGGSLSAGVEVEPGIWLLQPDELSGLSITVPAGGEDYTLYAVATTTDIDPDSGPRPTTSEPMEIVVKASDMAGNDTLYGNAGNDAVHGQAGDDTLYGGTGADSLYGGEGDDEIHFDADDLASGAIDGGEGVDTAILTGNDDIDFDLGAHNVEKVVSGSGKDRLITTKSIGVEMVAGAGDDVLVGGGGDDTLRGGSGNDAMNAGAGNDVIYADGEDLLGGMDGGEGRDTLYIDTAADLDLDADTLHVEELIAGSGNDNLRYGGDADVKLDGGAGNDTIYSGQGADTLMGGAGTDTLSYKGSAAGVNINLKGTSSGGSATGDVVSGFEVVEGSDHADTFIGDAGDNIFHGGDGVDKAIYEGDRADFSIRRTSEGVTVLGEGADSLDSIERLEFGDGEIGIKDFVLDSLISLEKGEVAEGVMGGAGEGLTYSIEDGPSHGELTLNGDGSYSYTGDANFYGRDSFSYKAVDENGVEYVGAVDVSVHNDSVMEAKAHNGLFGVYALPNGGLYYLKRDYVNGVHYTNEHSPVVLSDGRFAVYRKAYLGGYKSGTQKVYRYIYDDDGALDEVQTVFSTKGGDGNPKYSGIVHGYGASGNEIFKYWHAEGVGDSRQTTYFVNGKQVSQGTYQHTNIAKVGFDYELGGGVTQLADGNKVKTWRQLNDDGKWAVFAQLYDAGGGAIGDTEELGLCNSGSRICVAPTEGGKFMAMWQKGNNNYMMDVFLADSVPDGTDGNDVIYGMDQDNVIAGMGGDDHLMGNKGDDTLNGGDGADTLDGGEGADTATYADSDAGVTIDLAAGTGAGGHAEGDVLSGIENVIGSEYDDSITGDDRNNLLTGGKGDDTLDGGAGTDAAVYDGNFADYAVNMNADGSTTVDGGALGTDTLTNIELIQFNDRVIRLDGGNNHPDAVNDTVTAAKDAALTIAVADLLANDFDVDGDEIAVAAVSDPINGTVEINADGDVIFTPDAGYEGEASFKYTITDAHGATHEATVSVDVVAVAPPVAIDLDGDGLEFTSLAASVAGFDVDGDGKLEHTAWVHADDGVLAFDRNHDGVVNGFSEISFADDHADAKTDLQGLSLAYDSNHDGVFDAKDELWSGFGVWRDVDGDGVCQDGEFMSMDSAGVESINLVSDKTAAWNGDVWVHGTATATFLDGHSAEVGDIGLRYEDAAAPAEMITFGEATSEDSWLHSQLDELTSSGAEMNSALDAAADGGDSIDVVASMDTPEEVGMDLNPEELIQSMAAFHVDDADLGPVVEAPMTDAVHVFWDEAPTDDVNS